MIHSAGETPESPSVLPDMWCGKSDPQTRSVELPWTTDLPRWHNQYHPFCMLGQVAQEQGAQIARELNTGRRVMSAVGVNR